MFGFDSSKIHNCPNCNCNSQTKCNSAFLPRPMSPNHISRIVTPPYCTYVIAQNKPVSKQKILIKERASIRMNAPQNIYFRRTDRSDSRSSVNSNKSITSINSNEGKIIKIVSPSKKPVNISFRYSSPSKQQIQPLSNNVKRATSIIQINNNPSNNIYYNTQPNRTSLYQAKTVQSRPMSPINSALNHAPSFQYSYQVNQKSQNEPKVPNILKRKSSCQNKKDKSKSVTAQLSQLVIQEPKQMKFTKADLGTESIIQNKTNRKIENLKNNQFVLKGKWGNPSAYQILMQDEKTMANEIMKDLKLNYDYFDSTNSSKNENHPF